MAALTAPVAGNGTTVSGLGLTTLVRKITSPNVQLGGFNTEDLGTEDFFTMKKHTLANAGKVRVECYWTGAAITLGATGTFTLTWPLAGSLAGSGWISDVKYPDASSNEPLVGEYEITFDGYTGPSFTAA